MVDLIDTNGVKPTLKKGVLGYDDYSVGGDAGRLYVGTGTASIAQAKKSEVDSHTSNVSNPHSVTKTQVGLGNVDNTSDVNKPVSTATQTALNTKVDKITSTDNAIVRFDGTTGNVQNSGVIIDDSNNVNTSGSICSANMVGFKNYIINGNFDIWQYKDVGLTYPQTSSGYGSDDRWMNANVGSTKTHSQVVCTDTERALFNASFFSRTVVTSVAGAGNIVNKYQQIENVNKLAGKTVTLSFWAKADSAKNIAIELGQTFGTGETPSSPVTGIGSQLIALTTTWQKKTITVTIPSIVGKTLGTDGVHTTGTYLNFWFDVGSSYNSRSANLGQQSGTFDIAQVQLEEGSVATPFEQRPYGLELSLCQRYYETSGNYTIHWATLTPAVFAVNPIIRYAVPKRVTPTLSVAEVVGTLGIQIIGNGIYGFDFRNTNYNVGGNADKYFIFTSSAEL